MTQILHVVGSTGRHNNLVPIIRYVRSFEDAERLGHMLTAGNVVEVSGHLYGKPKKLTVIMDALRVVAWDEKAGELYRQNYASHDEPHGAPLIFEVTDGEDEDGR